MEEKQFSIEESFQTLEELLAKLESEDVGLNESFALYEQGMRLHAQLEALLAQQKKRIEQIDPETAEIEAFEGNEHDIS